MNPLWILCLMATEPLPVTVDIAAATDLRWGTALESTRTTGAVGRELKPGLNLDATASVALPGVLWLRAEAALGLGLWPRRAQQTDGALLRVPASLSLLPSLPLSALVATWPEELWAQLRLGGGLSALWLTGSRHERALAPELHDGIGVGLSFAAGARPAVHHLRLEVVHTLQYQERWQNFFGLRLSLDGNG